LMLQPQTPENYGERHTPLLQFYLKNIECVGSAGAGRAKGSWVLDNEDIEIFLIDRETGKELALNRGIRIRGGRRTDEQPVLDPNAPDPPADLKLQESDFYWLPQMRYVLPDAGEVKDDLFDDLAEYVVARFSLEEGYMGSHSLGAFYGGYVVAQFVPPVNPEHPYAQAVAHWAGVEISVDRRFDIGIRATPFDDKQSAGTGEHQVDEAHEAGEGARLAAVGHAETGALVQAAAGDQRRQRVGAQVKTRDGQDTRTLRLSLDNGDAEIEVRASNLCCGDFSYEESQAQGVTPDPLRFEVDHDFAKFYEISSISPDELGEYSAPPVPVPVKYPAKKKDNPESGGVDPIRCSGVRFKIFPSDKARANKEHKATEGKEKVNV